MLIKKCTKCGEEKPATTEFFNRQKSGDPLGLHARCRPCAAEARRLSYAKYRDSVSVRRKDSYIANKDKILERNRAYYNDNRDARCTKIREYRKNNKLKIRALNQKYYQNNRSQCIASAIKRQLGLSYRTPAWLTDFEVEEISCVYDQAKQLSIYSGITYEVDHIIPLSGDLVSGLHVPENLQILDLSSNRGKSNKFDPMSFVGP